jgi:quercetin dioxygenase-like cupin family protein
VVRPFVTHAREQPTIEWRPGVQTRLHTAGDRGATALCVIEQWCEPGRGAPTHTHFDVEEVIAVISGTGEFWVDGETEDVAAGGSVRLPPNSWHGFRNAGEDELHILAVFASDTPMVSFETDPQTILQIGARGRMLDAHRAIREG